MTASVADFGALGGKYPRKSFMFARHMVRFFLDPSIPPF